KIKEEWAFQTCFLIDDNKNFEEQWTWFNNGVDEFAYRDTNPMLIVQRVKNILRPYRKQSLNVPKKGFVIDRERYMVFVNAKEITLPRKEFELLMLLSSRPEKVFTREDIFRLVWGTRLVVGDRTIDVHIRKIREKIGEGYIVTVKGVGYKFVEKQ
ncbi:MAG: response regulator transcription factor, partial [Bacteroidales bacterium]|nr:response regulator transcription factor [Bacteroidales bacterium]